MSDETKHTPGPWTADEMVVTANVPRTEEPATRRFIADCHRLTSTIPADKANARLIAAAPDLLEACVALIRSDDLQRAIDLARAAIAKATGGK